MKFTEDECRIIAEYYKRVCKQELQYTVNGMAKATDMLNTLQQKIMMHKFIKNETFNQIGEHLSLSGGYVRSLTEKIMRMFNKPVFKDALMELGSNVNFKSDIDKLRLPSRVANILFRAGIRTVGDLQKYSYDDLRKINGCGETCMQQIQWALDKHNIQIDSIQPPVKRERKAKTNYKYLLTLGNGICCEHVTVACKEEPIITTEDGKLCMEAGGVKFSFEGSVGLVAYK